MQPNLVRSDLEILSRLSTVQNRTDLADLLEIPLHVLNYYLYHGEHYQIIKIRKKNGNERILQAPVAGLKIIQRKLLHILNLKFIPFENAFGFIKDRNIVQNARHHLNQTFILNIDLADFFPSIDFRAVRDSLRELLDVPVKTSNYLANLACIRERPYPVLPQGAPTSPLISNLVLRGLDTSLYHLTSKYKCKYTRYADDITISTSERAFPPELAMLDTYGELWIGAKLYKAVSRAGFEINYAKCRLKSRKQRQEVTGITISGSKLNVRRKFIRAIRAALFKWEQLGYESVQTEYLAKYRRSNDYPGKPVPQLHQVIRGKLNYLSMVKGKDDILYQKLRERFDSLMETIDLAN